eukprot:jgi/Antlo1/854/1965
MLEIREALAKIIRNEKVEEAVVMHADAYSKNESADDMSVDALLELSSFFVEAYILDQNKSESKERIMELSIKYCEECEYYGIVSEKFAEVRQRVMSSGFSREDRVFFHGQKTTFDTAFHRWDCRKWVMGLLRHLYILSVELYNFLCVENMLRTPPKAEVASTPGIKCMSIDTRGLRKSMLINRNKPTMTLAEFSEKLMRNMNTEKQASSESDVHDGENNNELERLRKRDEFRDDAHCIRGNTHGKG